MPAYLVFSEKNLVTLDAASRADVRALASEAMGWQPLGQGAYLHRGDADEDGGVVHVVGLPDVTMAGLNVLLLA